MVPKKVFSEKCSKSEPTQNIKGAASASNHCTERWACCVDLIAL